MRLAVDRTGKLNSVKFARIVAGLGALALLQPICALSQEVWRISESPTLELGSIDGPPSSEVFHDIRGAVYAADDRIVIADGGSQQLRIFSGLGQFIGTVGHDGEGPEEFRYIDWIDMCGGDALVVFDLQRARVTKWDETGNLLDEFRIDGTGGDAPPFSVSCGPDGTFAVVGWGDFSEVIGVGPYRPEVKIGIADREGHLQQVLGTFPGTERYRYPNNDGPRRLGKPTIVRMGANGVYVGTADSVPIELIGVDGLRRSFGKTYPTTPLTDALIDRYQQAVIVLTPENMRAVAQRTLDALEMPETLPAYSDFLLDKLGFTWVSLYRLPGERDTNWRAWEVFNLEGSFVASLQMPRDFKPTEIGVDYVLGVNTDAVGIQRVHMYALYR
jgi:6-bladed beta-propeller protein